MRRLAAAIALALGATLLTLAAPAAQAAPAPGVLCEPAPAKSEKGHGGHESHGRSGPPPHAYKRGYADTTPVTQRDLDALPMLGSKRLQRLASARLASRIYIPVHVKVIHGTHAGERGFGTTPKVKRLIRQLNYGFSGGQSLANPNTRYHFILRTIHHVRNDRWHHAALFSADDREAKQSLRTGNRRALNVFINGGEASQPVLGWARFPWQQRYTPALDSVSIHHAAMTGGAATGYNRGDTIIHEVGHWMGLFHTFQFGCDDLNDRVSDTPAERDPSLTCPRGRDTCPTAGVDPVTNFMDYSYDTCMNHFTGGQVARMDAAWAQYRL